MIILIVGVVVALVLFMLFRKLAGPAILLLGAVYLYNQFQEMTHGPATQGSGSTALASQPALTTPMPPNEAAMCKFLEDAQDSFRPLKADFNAARSEKSPIRRDQLIAQVQAKIDRMYSDRNRSIFDVIGVDEPSANYWVVRVTDISTITKDLGRGSEKYATLKVEMPCRVPVVLTSEDFPVLSRLGDTVGVVNSGEPVLISGSFGKLVKKSSPQEVVRWGSPLWGPFGGLWTDAIDAPAFRIKLRDAAPIRS